MAYLSVYEKLLDEESNGCISIRQALQVNKDSKIYCIYGLIELVQNSFCDNKVVGKVVTIQDPSTHLNLSIHIYGNSMFFEIGNIAKIKDIAYSFLSNHSFNTLKKNVIVIETFVHDYEDSNIGRFSDASEKKICKHLETWYSKKLSFESKNISINPFSKTYINLIGQVVRLDFLKQSVVISLWDSRVRNIKCYNPKDDSKVYQKDYNDLSMLNSELLHEYSLVNPEAIVFAYQKSLIINVWKNESDFDNCHFDKIKSFSFNDKKDFVILFNVEICQKSDNTIALTLRSGKHHGKGVKLVHRKSILGKLLLHQMIKKEKKIYQKYRAVNQLILD